MESTNVQRGSLRLSSTHFNFSTVRQTEVSQTKESSTLYKFKQSPRRLASCVIDIYAGIMMMNVYYTHKDDKYCHCYTCLAAKL